VWVLTMTAGDNRFNPVFLSSFNAHLVTVEKELLGGGGGGGGGAPQGF